MDKVIDTISSSSKPITATINYDWFKEKFKERNLLTSDVEKLFNKLEVENNPNANNLEAQQKIKF